jgi:hypothetical protein
MKCANKEDVTDSAKRAILTAAVREPRYLQLRLKPPAPEVILFGGGLYSSRPANSARAASLRVDALNTAQAVTDSDD